MFCHVGTPPRLPVRTQLPQAEHVTQSCASSNRPPGAMAGLLGVTVLQFRCIHQNAWHLIVWHGAVLVVSAGAAALLGGLDRIILAQTVTEIDAFHNDALR